MKILPKHIVTTIVCVAGLSVPLLASATNGILPLGNGMVAHGLGGAGLANAGDAMSGFDNPALVTETSNQMTLGVSLFNPMRSGDIGYGYVESESNYFPIPQFAWTKKANDAIAWGILVNAMGGMNTDYPTTSKLNPVAPGGAGMGIDLSGIIIAPTVSYKMDPKTSLGLSLLIGYEMLETTGTGASPVPNHKDSAAGTGIKLGVVTEMDGIRSAFMYQTKIDVDEMDKHCAFNPANALDPNNGIFGGFKASGEDCSLDLPPYFGIGFVYPVGTASKVVADFIKVNWTDVPIFEKAFHWEDQNVIKIGYEQKVNDGYTWRIGYNHGKSPIPDANIYSESPTFGPQDNAGGVLAPAITEDHLTFGFTKSLGGKMELTGYYAYIPEKEQVDPLGAPSPSPLGGRLPARAKMYQHALGIGVNWK